MKKKLILIIFIFFMSFIFNEANAACIQCPEIQKLIKKEFKSNHIKLTKEQKKDIKNKKREIKAIIKESDKKLKKNQKKIDKILSADCPDIVKMMEIKKENAKISKDKMLAIKTNYDELFYVYTPEQQYIAKRVLSENTGIKTHKPCIYCHNELKPNCKKCNKK